MNKNHFLTIFLFACSIIHFNLFAQVPQKFNYQGIARDAKGIPLANQKMRLKLSVLPTDNATAAEYEETQNVITNEFGLYTLQIGNGTPVSGEMKSIKWETGNKYIQVAIDPTGGNNFVVIGTTQLLSVPYAIYADKAGSTSSMENNNTRTGAVNSSATHVAGDANYLSKFTALNTIGKSILYDNGSSIGIGTISPVSSAKFHIFDATTNNTELRIQHTNATAGACRLSFFNDANTGFTATANYAIMNKYAEGITSSPVSAGYKVSKLFGFNNSQGSLLFSTGGNIGFGYYNQSTSTVTVRMHIDSTTGRIGFNTNNAVTPVAHVHFNYPSTGDTLKITNTTTGALISDGLDIRTTGNAASIVNRENDILSLGTNNLERLRISNTGNIGIGTTNPTSKLEIQGSVKIVDGTQATGKILTSDASGFASWQDLLVTPHFIGEFFDGGIIFALDDKKEHGLIASLTDQAIGIRWDNNQTSTMTNAIRDGLFSGLMNTERIISKIGVGNNAAQQCSNYTNDNYGDWYLPSKYELDLMFQNQGIIGGFAQTNYWCSVEDNLDNAWRQDFLSGLQQIALKSAISNVRAIRSF